MPYWHIGQKVVCIRSLAAPYGVKIVQNEVYTIRDIFRSPDPRDDVLGLALAEVICRKRDDGEDCWHERYFRPVRETSIDCFQAILTSSEVRDAERNPVTVDDRDS